MVVKVVKMKLRVRVSLKADHTLPLTGTGIRETF